MEESRKIKLAINGFGRIGRAACKVALEYDEIELVAINDLGEIANLGYLLHYDSVYGRYSRAVRVEGDGLVVGDTKIKIFSEAEPKKLPWGNLGIDVVIESTGVFNDKAGAAGHIEAGAKKVIISAPTKDESIPTIVLGVNDEKMAGNDIISNASCTTNNAAPVMKVVDELFGVKKAMLTTVHAYTATQGLVDAPAKSDWRRGRAAGVNITPSSTGAAVAATLAYPKIKGKFDGVALRVPVAVVSISDFVMLVKKKVTVEDINAAFEDAADKGGDKCVLGVTSEPVASSDFIGDPRSAIVDLAMTRVVDGDLVKVMAWYDNEWGYSNRLIEQVMLLGK